MQPAGPAAAVATGNCSAEAGLAFAALPTETGAEANFCTNEMYRFLVRDNIEMREQIVEFLKDPLYRPTHHLSLAEFRELTLLRLQKFVQQRFFSVSDYTRDPPKFMAALESIFWADYSLSIKAGVHFTLCGGTIAKLGTAKHHAEWLPKLDDLSLPGCFGMTELAHGSNVMGIETTAVYDVAAGEFVINTPHDLASKYWIGGSGQHGKVCTVFAQLTVKGEWQGPHVFVVRLRDDAGNLMPNVRIRDHGAKMGLNGVDNGRIWFDNVRVPRDAMLDSLASVDQHGNYSSKVPGIPQRFGATIGGLTTGRILIAQGGVDGCKLALTIAIRYSAARTQFGDVPILSYVTQQRRLMPALATTYAFALGQLRLKEMVFSKGDPKAIHVLSSGLKAAATWTRTRVMQDCRECCGGMGVKADNRIGPMMNDQNVDVTFEGDNTVLMQQVAKAVLEAPHRSKAPLRPPSVSLAHASGPHGPLLADLGELLTYRDKSLAAELAGAMGAAAARATDAKGRSAAMAAAFQDNMDLSVDLGWSHTDRLVFGNFVDQITRAPERSRPVLRLLATLYGLSCVEGHMDFYLAQGALKAADRSAVRRQINALCGRLAADGGRMAISLCDSFGIPDHIVHAPIAFDWTKAE